MVVTFHLYGSSRVTDDPLTMQRNLVQQGGGAGRPNIALGDSGLRFNKFFGRWSAVKPLVLLKELPDKKRTEPILDWLDPHPEPGSRGKGSFTTLKAGDEGRLAEAGNRLKTLAEAKGGIWFDLELDSRFLTGIGLPHPSENGFLFHPTLAVPYVRGTALKQVASDWAEENGAGAEERARLFGAVAGNEPVSSGLLAFLDAVPLSPVILTAEQITRHYGPYYDVGPIELFTRQQGRGERRDLERPADWYESVPVTLLAVEADITPRLTFRFVVLPLRHGTDHASPADLEKAETWLTEGLLWRGVGAKTTLGYGRFISTSAADTRRERNDARRGEWRRADEAAVERAQQAEADALARRKAAWVPAVGDSVIYSAGGEDELRVVSRMGEKEGDFFLTLPDGSDPIKSDASECTPVD